MPVAVAPRRKALKVDAAEIAPDQTAIAPGIGASYLFTSPATCPTPVRACGGRMWHVRCIDIARTLAANPGVLFQVPAMNKKIECRILLAVPDSHDHLTAVMAHDPPGRIQPVSFYLEVRSLERVLCNIPTS
jgi:hypothetical protein